MDTLKKAGLMTQHLDLFHHMQDLRGLLQLAAHMEERGDRAALISAGSLTLIGGQTLSESEVRTSKGATIAAPVVYRLIAQLKGFEDDEYTVNRRELAALNTRAVADLESSDALRAFADTLARIGAASAPAPESQPAPALTANAEAAAPERPNAERSNPERPNADRQSRGRRVPEEQAGEGVAAAN